LFTHAGEKDTSGFKAGATVYRVNSARAVVQAIQLISPVLNHPYAFGTAAAAHALGEIYALGVKPEFALNLASFPVKSLPLDILQEILQGGRDKVLEAGAVITSGYYIQDHAPKYGLSVTALADPSCVLGISGAKAGDVLYLTKPLGTGVVCAALERGQAGEEVEEKAWQLMAHLNRGASEAMIATGVHACSMISGFGLLGHLYQMLASSGVTACIYADRVPVMPEAGQLLSEGVFPPRAQQNLRHVEKRVNWNGKGREVEATLWCDPQTSGGLLISVPPEKAEQLKGSLEGAGCLASTPIGEITGEIDTVPFSGNEPLIEIIP